MTKPESQVVSLKAIRDEKIEEKRRTYERIVFRNTLGVYTVVDQQGLHAIDLVDISEGGLSFQLPEKSNVKFSEGDTLTLRFYISTDNYLMVAVKIVRSFTAIDQGQAMTRYGCLIDKSLASYAAIFHFVQFIAKCAEFGQTDHKKLKVFY